MQRISLSNPSRGKNMTGSPALPSGAKFRSLQFSSPFFRSFVIKPLALAALMVGSGLAGPARAEASPGAFLPHQALYDLNLVKARGSSVNDARGRILYTFSGSACEGYTSEFHQVSELESGEDKVTLSELRSTAWEDGSGKSYRFKIDSKMNDADSSAVEGHAERTGDHI